MDLILFGIQGSGKGTQAKKLAEEFGYEVFEAGGELRKIAATGTELGRTVSSSIDHGHLVPLEIIMDVVREAVRTRSNAHPMLFDGIPRDADQQKSFDHLMQELGRAFRGVHLTVNEEAAVQRIIKRAKDQGRADDANEEFIRRRMGIFHTKTEPVIESYRAQGKMMDVNGDGTVEEVYERLKEALGI